MPKTQGRVTVGLKVTPDEYRALKLVKAAKNLPALGHVLRDEMCLRAAVDYYEEIKAAVERTGEVATLRAMVRHVRATAQTELARAG
jgi:hypothetical protein